MATESYWDQFQRAPIGGSLTAQVQPGGQTAPIISRPGTGSYTQPGVYQPMQTSGAPSGNPMSIIQQASQGLPPSQQSLNQIVNALHQAGYSDARIATHAGGQLSGDKVEIPSLGMGWDLITASDSPQASWNVGGGNQGYNIGTGASLGTSAAGGGSLSSLFGGGLSGQASPMGGVATNAPLLQPWNTPFMAPTGATEQNDPGFQFRLNQGMQALERSAAGKGTLLTGGTLKDLTQYAQDYASNEYGNVYNRALQQYGLGYDIFQNNQANQFNRLFQVAGLGENAAAGVGNLGANYSGQAAGLYTGIGNAQAAGTVGAANAYGQLPGQLASIYGLYRGYNPGNPSFDFRGNFTGPSTVTGFATNPGAYDPTYGTGYGYE